MPPEVLTAFFGSAPIKSERLGEGLVNRTFLVHVSNQLFVLQQLNPIFDETLITDSATISKALTAAGWEVPTAVPSVDGMFSLRDRSGALWRCLTYIESDGIIPKQPSKTQLQSVGELLSRWHQTLRSLSYKPSFVIPHFHDTSYYAARLEELQVNLPDAECSELATRLLAAYVDLTPLPEMQAQLIHGDPQLTNILFRNGKPFTYIDLDTIMLGSIWLDIGDLLRATLEDDLKAERPLELTNLQSIITGYRTSSDTAFYSAALIATQRIALELAMRFMSDIVDDNYFDWDTSRFTSRRDNHLFRAGMQWKIHEAVSASLDTIE